MSLKKEENEIIMIAEHYKRIFCSLIKNGKEANLVELLKDGAGDIKQELILDFARENLNPDQRFIIHIHFCLSLLDSQEKEIIWKEYFLNQRSEKKSQWWEYNYARSTFYRIRNRAIKKFYGLCHS